MKGNHTFSQVHLKFKCSWLYPPEDISPDELQVEDVKDQVKDQLLLRVKDGNVVGAELRYQLSKEKKVDFSALKMVLDFVYLVKEESHAYYIHFKFFTPTSSSVIMEGKWVEIGNSGIFRPEMLLPMGLPEDVIAIAWGLSLERLISV